MSERAKNPPTRRNFLGLVATTVGATAIGVSPTATADAADAPTVPIVVAYLRCEYLVDPLGIDETRPRLSWLLLSDRRGARQTAYQIAAASTPGDLQTGKFDLWDSGRVASDETTQVEYAGKPLTSRMQCHWQVRVWDEAGAASHWSPMAQWTMGLLQPTDWQAQWIGMGEPKIAASASREKLVIRRALYQVEHNGPSRDVTALVAAQVKDDQITLRVKNDNLGGDPQLNRHKTLHVEYTLGGKPGTVDLPEDADLVLPPPDTTLFDANGLAIPRCLRKTFTVHKPIHRATVYATALGLYELGLNGGRVGDHLLAPEWTSYHKRVQYQTFDVTGQLKTGPNALSATLGNGWYCGLWQHWPPKINLYGTEPYLIAQLEIEYTDGARETVATDATWRATTDGPLRFSGLYEGEIYDARRHMPGWDTAHFDDSHWAPVKIGHDLKPGKLVAQHSPPIRVQKVTLPAPPVPKDDFVWSDPAAENRFARQKPAVKVTQPTPGVYVLDFGQNIAGWTRIQMKGQAGQTITLKHNEMLNPDGTVYMDNLHAGHMSRGDRQTVRYTFRGEGVEIYEPHFTYHGFRYVQIEGLTDTPPPFTFTAVRLNTDCPEVGDFHCSDPLVSRLAQNILWSQRGNFVGVPTDCPSRDERCGYTGDAQFFMPTAIYNMDIAAFFTKWLTDVCDDSQRPDGGFADQAPDFGVGISWNVGWYDAGIICPHRLYRTYGDTRIIRKHYAAMKRCLQMQENTSKNNTRERIGNGDWLNLGGGASNVVIGTAYFAYDYFLMAEMADAIGETADAAAFHKRATEIAATFASLCIAADGSIVDSSQTGYALAYTMGLVPESQRTAMAARFAEQIDRFHDHLATGFIGTPRLLPALRLAGRDDLACELLLQKDYPSWLYPITLGATTMWERWNGWTPEHGFADSGMNSFNHYSFGAVGEYLFGGVGGIQAESPGWKTIRIQPAVDKRLGTVSTYYQSIRGAISTRWHIDGADLTLEVTIPPNTTATVYVPTSDPSSVRESGKAIGDAVGVTAAGVGKGVVMVRMGAGSYRFASRVG